MNRVIAIDFDGCICTNVFPKVGAPNWRVIANALSEQAKGASLILCTAREGELLRQAVAACREWGLHFDAVKTVLRCIPQNLTTLQ